MSKSVTSKPFLSIDEQLRLLERRGVIIDDEEQARSFLLSNNYYRVINGYKAPFIDTRKTNAANDDRYIKGISFDHFVAMYEFDATLRAVTLQALEQAENALKTSLVYSFCSVFPEPDAYLNEFNYALVSCELSKLLNHLKGIQNRQMEQKDYLKHYKNSHGAIPLWVLAPVLSFGVCKKLYTYQLDQVKTNMEINLGKAIGKPMVPRNAIKRAFNVLTFFRNIAAHGERLYNAHMKEGVYFSDMLDSLQSVSTSQTIERYQTQLKDACSRIKKLEPNVVTEKIAKDTRLPLSFFDIDM